MFPLKILEFFIVNYVPSGNPHDSRVDDRRGRVLLVHNRDSLFGYRDNRHEIHIFEQKTIDNERVLQ